MSLTGRAQRAERRRGGSPTEAGAEEGERAPVWERRRLAQLAVAAAELEGRGAEESSAGAPASPICRCWGREKAWGAGPAGGARYDGGGLELRRSLSSVRRRGLEFRAARAMAEFAPAQVATDGAAPAGLVEADEQGPTLDGAGPSLPTPSPSPTAAYRRSRGPAELSSAPRPSSSAAATASCAGLRPPPFSGRPPPTTRATRPRRHPMLPPRCSLPRHRDNHLRHGNFLPLLAIELRHHPLHLCAPPEAEAEPR